MKLIWTKSNLPLSLLIRGITGEDCSHFAFVFEQEMSGLVVESNLLGCVSAYEKVMLAPGFWSDTLVHSVDLPLTTAQESDVWALLYSTYAGAPYDYMGALYAGYRKILNRISARRWPMPDKNPWATKGAYYCDELYSILVTIPGVAQIQAVGTCKTPHDLWLALGGTSS
jgi:hypothetical protein